MCCSGTIRNRAAQRGFVLATTLLVTTLLTVMLAASFFLVSAEQRTTDNSFGAAKALAIAESGLQSYFSLARPLSAGSVYDSVRIGVASGYADVVARRVRPSGATVGSTLSLWVVSASGVATGAILTGQTRGGRTVAQFAQLNSGSLQSLAAMVAANGVTMQASGSNPINGHDACGMLDLYGLATSSLGYSDTSHGNPTPPSGSPAGIDYVGAQPSSVIAATHIDWTSLVAGAFYPDYVYPGASLPAAGSSLVGYAPATGGVVIPPGTWGGTLVARGNVTMSDGATWHGILIAGGMLSPASPSAVYTISGMIVTGLNIALGQGVQANQVRRGSTETIQWSSCDFITAIAGMSALVPLGNAWADTWTTY